MRAARARAREGQPRACSSAAIAGRRPPRARDGVRVGLAGRRASLWTLEAAGAAGRVGAVDEVICPGVRGRNLVAAALAGLRARGWCGAAGARSRSTSGSRSPRGWAAAPPTPRRRCGSRSALAPGRAGGVARARGRARRRRTEPARAGTGARDRRGRDRRAGRAARAARVRDRAGARALSTAEVYREADRLGGLRSGAGAGRGRAAPSCGAARRRRGCPRSCSSTTCSGRRSRSSGDRAGAGSAARMQAPSRRSCAAPGRPSRGFSGGRTRACAPTRSPLQSASGFPRRLSAVPVDAGFGTPALA